MMKTMTYKLKTIIQKDKVVFENANKAHGFGKIDPNNFMPYPKNPSTIQDERTKVILAFCKQARTSQEIMDFLELKSRKHFRTTILNPLIEDKLLSLTIPDKPNSPKQKYIAITGEIK